MLEIGTIANIIKNDIIAELERLGLMSTIFSRLKSALSVAKKLTRKDYLEGKLIQDFIGIRIALYFPDDLPIVINLLRNMFPLDNKDIDSNDEETFRPKRLNLVFRLKDDNQKIFKEAIKRQFGKNIDSTFEVQIRTILSEGWHEVEHDLRYKCREDWVNHMDLSRTLNGIYATLETSEWAMLNLFNDLAYRHYKEKEWEPMLRNKFRLKILGHSLSEKIVHFFNDNINVAKEIYKIDRSKFISRLSKSRLSLPFTYDNLVFVINHLYLRDQKLSVLQPDFIRDEIAFYLGE